MKLTMKSAFKAAPTACALAALTLLGGGDLRAADPAPCAAIHGPQAQVLGGGAAAIEETPGQGALRYQDAQGVWVHDCSVVAIHADWALTAAHCFYVPKRRHQIVFGAADLGAGGAERVFEVTEVIRHPGYRGRSWTLSHGDDLALLRLDRPYEGPLARLAQPGEAPAPEGALAEVFGWGRTGGAGPQSFPMHQGGAKTGRGWAGSATLKKARMAVMSEPACRAAIDGSDFQGAYRLGPERLCAAPVDGPGCGTTGDGDSGSPLILWDAAGPVTHGLVSWGYDANEPSLTVFTRVSAYAAWIEATIAGAPVQSAAAE